MILSKYILNTVIYIVKLENVLNMSIKLVLNVKNNDCEKSCFNFQKQ